MIQLLLRLLQFSSQLHECLRELVFDYVGLFLDQLHAALVQRFLSLEQVLQQFGVPARPGPDLVDDFIQEELHPLQFLLLAIVRLELHLKRAVERLSLLLLILICEFLLLQISDE